MSTGYSPRPGSLPSMVIGHLRLNPKAELTLDDIADKFSAARSSIHTNLALALDSGQLKRDKNEEDEYVYKAGPGLQSASSGIDMDAVHRPPQKRLTAARRGPVELPDPAKVEIEIGVPLPERRTKIDWQPLLKRLKVNDSAKLPLAAKHTLSQAVTAAQQANQGKYTLRTFPATNELRIWRLA